MDLFSYQIALRDINATMRRQLEDDQPEPDREVETPPAPSRTTRARLAIGSALHALADGIDPAPRGVPSQQH